MNSKKPLNILYIQKPAGGGSVIALYEMLRMLNRQYFHPVVLCYENNMFTNTLETLNLPVFYLRQPQVPNNVSTSKAYSKSLWPKWMFTLKGFLFTDFKVAKKISRIIQANEIDIIHHNNDVFLSRQGLLANLNIKKPQLCHYRSLKRYRHDWVNSLIDKILVKHADYNIYISHAVQHHFEKHLGIDKRKGKLVRDIVDQAKFAASPVHVNKLKQEFGFGEQDIIVSNIARITRWKGQDIFIKAFAKASIKVPALKALIVGPYEAGVGDESFYLELQHLVNSLGLQDKVLFTGNRQDVAAIINLSQIIAHTAVEPEPQGLVLIEALFAGKPVIAADAGGAAELVENYISGIKVKPADPDALCAAILQTIEAGYYHNTIHQAKILIELQAEQQMNEIEMVYQLIVKKVRANV